MRRRAGLLVVLLASLVTLACSSAPNDQQIVSDIKAKLYSSELLKGTNLQVASLKGEVTLTGEVPNDAARYEAFKLALDSKGVTRVNDQMTLRVAQVEAPPAAEEPKPVPKPAPVRKAPRRIATPSRVEAAPPPPSPAPAETPAMTPVAAPVQQAAPPPAPEPPKPKRITIDPGTMLAVRMIDSVDSGENQPGETFRGSLDAPVDVDGEEVIPRGTDVTLRLAEAQSAGRMAGKAELKLELAYIEFQGRRYTVQSSEVVKSGRSEGKRTAATVGGTAAVGAIIGAIAGGGKGAAIGAAAGAGAGAAASVITKGKQVKVPSETLLEFRLEAPLTVTVMPGERTSR
jgi:hypothetical protein